jgi:hypothetical protein
VELWLVVHRDLVRTARVRAVIEFLAAVSTRTTKLPPKPQWGHRKTPVARMKKSGAAIES